MSLSHLLKIKLLEINSQQQREVFRELIAQRKISRDHGIDYVTQLAPAEIRGHESVLVVIRDNCIGIIIIGDSSGMTCLGPSGKNALQEPKVKSVIGDENDEIGTSLSMSLGQNLRLGVMGYHGKRQLAHH